MPANKNQHFVPRCHLRPFTVGSQDAAISLFNLNRHTFISNAPVKNQCSKDYFYGKDDNLEKAIQFIESGYGTALRGLTENHRVFSEHQKAVFKTFWLFQYFRTEAVAIRIVQIAETTREFADLPPKEFTLAIKDAVQMGCSTFLKSIREIDDLCFCVVKNHTKVPFVTSDNPAIMTNKWKLDKYKHSALSFGISSAGMLLMLPLTPKLLLIGYDSDVYNIISQNGIVEVKNTSDIIAYNRHQFLNCVSNVYVHDANIEKLIYNQYLEAVPFRPSNRFIIRMAQLEKTDDTFSRYVIIDPEARQRSKETLLHTQIIHPHPEVWPSQIRVHPNGSVFTNGTAVGYVRLSRTFQDSHVPFWRERA